VTKRVRTNRIHKYAHARTEKKNKKQKKARGPRRDDRTHVRVRGRVWRRLVDGDLFGRTNDVRQINVRISPERQNPSRNRFNVFRIENRC